MKKIKQANCHLMKSLETEDKEDKKMNIKNLFSAQKTLSGFLKLALAIVFSLLFNIAFADIAPDFTKPENYLPGKKYRIYGSGRGEVTNLRGSVNLSGGLSSVSGSFGRETSVYDGNIQYEQVFHDHPYWEHGPFDSSQIANFSNRFATVSDGFIVNRVTIKARELHPADGYDGEQGGGFPSPTGARDEYTYEVHGTSAKIKPVYPDKPKTLPETPNREPNWSDNEPFSEPLTDNDIERIRDYLNTVPNAEGLPDGAKDAKQPHDFDWTQGNWDSVETPKDSGSDWVDALWGGLKELAAGARDYQADGAQYGVPVGAWGDGNQYAQPDPYAPSNSAEQLGANVAAIGSVIGARSPTSLGRNVAKHADDIAEAAATAARKVEKTTDAATDVAGAGLKYEPAPYHSRTGNNVKSPAPTNGQDVLNNSVPIGNNTSRRVGVDKTTGEYVVFDKHADGTYHGHTRPWSGEKGTALTTQMKNALINAGLTNRKGKIQ
ncbi:MAG: MafB family polymorphic toxin [Neisseriaceae bacterium]|nr:MafB family polymorphic toxin [Neisseriaceae bacterium]